MKFGRKTRSRPRHLFPLTALALGAALTASLPAIPAHAAGKQDLSASNAPSSSSRTAQIKLTPGLVDHFIQGMGVMMEIARRHGLEMMPSKRERGENGPMMNLRLGTAKTEVEQKLRNIGFRNYDHWHVVATNTMAAYAYVKAGVRPEAIQNQMQTAMEQVLNNPQIPEQQKARIREQMAKMKSNEAVSSPPPGNIAVVKTKMAALDQLITQMREMSQNN